MIPSAWLRWTPMRAALGFLLVALLVAGYTLTRAVQLTETEAGVVPALPNPGELSPPPSGPTVDIEAAVSRDAFDIMRAAPTNRYLLASEIPETETSVAPPPRVVVLGIALADGGRSFATAQVGAERPVIVRVGDKLGPYTVKAIESKRVTVTLPGGAVQIIAALNSGLGN
ncbi:MAG: hypothetical protein ABI120_25980 [Gemmatimonadaceae bacterium]